MKTPLSEDEDHLNNRITKPETKRALFNEIADEETHESEYQNAWLNSTIVGSNVTEDINNYQKDREELSSIRNQLAQIETQQSNLFDLLQVIFHLLINHNCYFSLKQFGVI